MTNPNPPTPAPPLLSLQDPHCASNTTDSVLQQEIRVLRERGLADEAILHLLKGFHINAHPEPFGPNWNLPPHDQLIRLIWGQPNPLPLLFD
ncbi:MAG: hypothetical protein ACP5E5_03645 [Acidobacteriaceae bacterium]